MFAHPMGITPEFRSAPGGREASSLPPKYPKCTQNVPLGRRNGRGVGKPARRVNSMRTMRGSLPPRLERIRRPESPVAGSEALALVTGVPGEPLDPP